MIIYKTTNLINGKIYIGQDKNNNPKYLGSGLLIARAFKRYGITNFKKEILEICDSKEALNKQEIFWINELSSTNKEIGYNISKGGTGGKLVEVEGKKGKTYEEYYGIEKSKLIKQKSSETRKGKPIILKNITREELNLKISKGNKGKFKTDAEKEIIRQGVKRYFDTEQGKIQKEKNKTQRKGILHSEETKTKIRDKMKGFRPKVLDVHPSARYWYFYDKDNNLVLETLGDRTKKLKELKTNQKRIEIFDNLDDCLNHQLSSKKDFKIYWKKYYQK